ncbi:hypothetical protein OAT84_01185 [Gammaproteobacteria bacterium]|nr:hypothetical protein [Gammaproteobacteria bacterium]
MALRNHCRGFMEKILSCWLNIGPFRLAVNFENIGDDGARYHFFHLKLFGATCFSFSRMRRNLDTYHSDLLPYPIVEIAFSGLKVEFDQGRLSAFGFDIALLPLLTLTLLSLYAIQSSPFLITGFLAYSFLSYHFLSCLAAYSVITESIVLFFNRAVNFFRCPQNLNEFGYWSMPLLYLMGSGLVLAATLTTAQHIIWLSTFLFLALAKTVLQHSSIFYISTQLLNLKVLFCSIHQDINEIGGFMPVWNWVSIKSTSFSEQRFQAIAMAESLNKDDMTHVRPITFV